MKFSDMVIFCEIEIDIFFIVFINFSYGCLILYFVHFSYNFSLLRWDIYSCVHLNFLFCSKFQLIWNHYLLFINVFTTFMFGNGGYLHMHMIIITDNIVENAVLFLVSISLNAMDQWNSIYKYFSSDIFTSDFLVTFSANVLLSMAPSTVNQQHFRTVIRYMVCSDTLLELRTIIYSFNN